MKTSQLDKLIGKTKKKQLIYVINSLNEMNDILIDNLNKKDQEIGILKNINKNI
jgi:hypothetical protein